MKLAVMQPYLFPYIGYFQLIHAVDKFVFLDDVNFINKGWINRNRILVNGKEHLFSIPLKKVSQNKLILECELADEKWQEKFLKTIEMSYKKTPMFHLAFPLIKDIIHFEEKNLSLFIFNQFKKIFLYMNLNPVLIQSSAIYKTSEFKGQEKIISICLQENATQYINPIGGTGLYENKRFIEENIMLKFIKSNPIIYKQNSTEFVPWLSIIDVLMYNSKETILDFLSQYTLITNE